MSRACTTCTRMINRPDASHALLGPQYYFGERHAGDGTACGIRTQLAAGRAPGTARRAGRPRRRTHRRRSRACWCAARTGCCAPSPTSAATAPVRWRYATARARAPCTASTTAGPTRSTASCAARRRCRAPATSSVEDIRLPPLRVHEWQGLVFVALDATTCLRSMTSTPASPSASRPIDLSAHALPAPRLLRHRLQLEGLHRQLPRGLPPAPRASGPVQGAGLSRLRHRVVPVALAAILAAARQRRASTATARRSTTSSIPT